MKFVLTERGEARGGATKKGGASHALPDSEIYTSEQSSSIPLILSEPPIDPVASPQVKMKPLMPIRTDLTTFESLFLSLALAMECWGQSRKR